MNIVTIILISTMVWWITFFILLPFGVKINRNNEDGHADSAPENPMILRKIIITTIITFTLTFAFYLYMSSK